MNGIRISSIVAIAANHVIGRDNAMIWHIPEDLKHFKKTTLGKPIVMGRKSYESLGKPLPGRVNIVVSRAYKDLPQGPATQVHQSMEAVAYKVEAQSEDGPFLYASIDDGIKAAKNIATKKNLDEIFITGGGEIYKQTLPITDRLYLTLIHKDYEGDTSFPEFDWDDWKIISEDKREGDTGKNIPPYTFYILDRR